MNSFKINSRIPLKNVSTNSTFKQKWKKRPKSRHGVVNFVETVINVNIKNRFSFLVLKAATRSLRVVPIPMRFDSVQNLRTALSVSVSLFLFRCTQRKIEYEIKNFSFYYCYIGDADGSVCSCLARCDNEQRRTMLSVVWMGVLSLAHFKCIGIVYCHV